MPVANKTWSIGTTYRRKPAPFRKCGMPLCSRPALYELVILDGERMVVCREHEDVNFIRHLRNIGASVSLDHAFAPDLRDLRDRSMEET